MADAIDGVVPEPLAHCVGVGVDEQHTEGGAADGVDKAALRNAKVLEPHKGGNRHQQGKRHITVRYHIVLRDIPIQIIAQQQYRHYTYHTDYNQCQ